MTNKEQQRLSRVVWFEIPATNLDRAIRFYEQVFETKLIPHVMGSVTMAVFPYTEPAISGCVIQSEFHKPGEGPILYLNADPSVDAALSRVEAAGGSIVQPRTELPADLGVCARILDTEGNAVGLHAIS